MKLDNVRMILLDDGANPCKYNDVSNIKCSNSSKFHGHNIFCFLTNFILTLINLKLLLDTITFFLSSPLGSLASSDMFFEAYSLKGLNREALCPCAGSPETLTLSLRRYYYM